MKRAGKAKKYDKFLLFPRLSATRSPAGSRSRMAAGRAASGAAGGLAVPPAEARRQKPAAVAAGRRRLQPQRGAGPVWGREERRGGR